MKLVAKKNTTYRAHIKLGFLEGFVSNDVIKGKLEAVGLTRVTVQGSGRERWAFGTWPGNDVEVDLPSQIVGVDKV